MEITTRAHKELPNNEFSSKSGCVERSICEMTTERTPSVIGALSPLYQTCVTQVQCCVFTRNPSWSYERTFTCNNHEDISEQNQTDFHVYHSSAPPRERIQMQQSCGRLWEIIQRTFVGNVTLKQHKHMIQRSSIQAVNRSVKHFQLHLCMHSSPQNLL